MVTKEYQNFKFQQPYQQAMYYCSLILQDNTWPWMDGLEVIPHLEADDLVKFVPMLLSRAFLECYIAGSYISTIFLLSFLEVWYFIMVLLSSGNFIFQETLNQKKQSQ